MNPEGEPGYAEAGSVARGCGPSDKWEVSVIAEPHRLQTLAAAAFTNPQVIHFLLLIGSPPLVRNSRTLRRSIPNSEWLRVISMIGHPEVGGNPDEP